MNKYFFLLLSLFATGFASPLHVGDDAPNFMLKDQEGFTHDLISHRGNYVVLFFYQRDFTFPAQKKMRSMESLLKNTLNDKLIVYGVSNDCVKDHHKFYDRMHISFDLLSDSNEKVIRAYNAKGLIETKPLVVLIGPDGRVFRVYDNMQKFLYCNDIINSIISSRI